MREVVGRATWLVENWIEQKGLDHGVEINSCWDRLEGRIVIANPSKKVQAVAGELLEFVAGIFGEDFKVRLLMDENYIVLQARPKDLLISGEDEEKEIAESMDEEYTTIMRQVRKRGDEQRITKWHIERALDAWGYTEVPPVVITDTSAFTAEQVSELEEVIRRTLGESREYDTLFWRGLQKVLEWFAIDFNAGTFDAGGW